MENLKKKMDYIACPTSSPEQFRKGYFLDPLSPMEGLEVIHRRYSPVGKRNFKHGIFSFGVSDISPQFALDVSRLLMDYYAQKYPMLLCVHTNIPKRIHAHFIMDTCSVVDGKKFSQSPAEFEAYRQYFNSVMKKNDLPLLKNASIEVEPFVKEQPDFYTVDDFYYEEKQNYCAVPSFWSTVQPNQSPVIYQPQPLMQQPSVRIDCKISCDVDSIIQNMIVGMTELTMIMQKKSRRNLK